MQSTCACNAQVVHARAVTGMRCPIAGGRFGWCRDLFAPFLRTRIAHMELKAFATPLLAVSLLLAAPAARAGNATADEATAMVRKGVAFIKAEGTDKGYAEISNRQGRFV